MNKIILVALVGLLPFSAAAQTTFASWSLNNTAVATSQSYITASSLTIGDANNFGTTYTTDGVSFGKWKKNYDKNHYFQIAITTNSGKLVNLKELNFQYRNNGDGPQQATMKYVILNVEDPIPADDIFLSDAPSFNGWNNNSLNTADTNQNVQVALNLNLQSNQRIVIRFYGRDATNNQQNFTINKNTLNIKGTEDPAGTDAWIGYAYNWNGSSPTTYLGYVTEPIIFDRNVGTGSIAGTTSSLSATPSNNFFVRYKMTTNAIGKYNVTVGGDDGYRLSIDGGNTWVINNFVNQSYTTRTVQICLSGTTNFVLEYYENTGNSRVSFSYNQITSPPTLITGNTDICQGSSTVLTATGPPTNGTTSFFEWGTGAIGSTILTSQTGSSITISPTTTTTYWVRVRDTFCTTTFSTALTSTVNVTAVATAPTGISSVSSSYCSSTPLTLTATGGTGTTYQWGIGTTIGANAVAANTASISVSPTETTVYWVRRVNSSPCSGFTNGVFKTITVGSQGDPTAFGNNEWNVFGYNSDVLSNPTNYQGYYVQNLGANVGFDSKLKWADNLTPSAAPDWQGCTINVSNYMFIHKRKGFPCGRYQLAFSYYDDDTIVTVRDANGTIWTQSYANFYNGGAGPQPINGTNTFALDSNSTIEVRTRNGNGDSKAGLLITSSGIATYANGSWNKIASFSTVQINTTLSLPTDLTVCSCTVQAGATITVPDNVTLTVLDNVTVATTGKIIVENNGSFVQINNNATFTGAAQSFEMRRSTQPVFRFDYVYWSSPIKESAGFTLNNLSPQTLRTRYMKWRHTTSPQAWEIILDGTEVMVPGRGYIVRAPQTYNIEGVGASQIYPAAFIGVPNNGIITHPVSGSTGVNTWNLIGNPYPSAMDATTFLNANAQTLGGTLYFWTHNTAFSSVSNFSYSTSDYATWNGTGGVATAAVGDVNDNISVPTGRIAAGQSFFVRGIGEGAGTINFDNTMRVAGSNNQFFRPTPTQPVDDWQITGKHRIWLNLRGETQGFNQTLVGYIPSATNALDHLYDGDSFGGNQVTFYSILGAKNLVIQGRALPFSNQDEVPLGYKTTLVGTLNISIDHHDGLFEGQNIYIKDNLLNIVHNLKEAPYLFTTVAGTFNDRFVLRYLPEASLGTNTPIIEANSILVFNKSNQISIKSTSHTISKVEIYDLQGRLLFSQNKVYKQEFTTQELHVNKQVVVVKITTDLDGIWIKKVVIN
jgi:hypothetical protein